MTETRTARSRTARLGHRQHRRDPGPARWPRRRRRAGSPPRTPRGLHARRLLADTPRPRSTIRRHPLIITHHARRPGRRRPADTPEAGLYDGAASTGPVQRPRRRGRDGVRRAGWDATCADIVPSSGRRNFPSGSPGASAAGPRSSLPRARRRHRSRVHHRLDRRRPARGTEAPRHNAVVRTGRDLIIPVLLPGGPDLLDADPSGSIPSLFENPTGIPGCAHLTLAGAPLRGR